MSDYEIKPLGKANICHKRPWNTPRFLFGACYYPEHWDEHTRELDAQRMAEAGINVVRMAEFAWHLMEPVEGKFDFSFFDAQIARLGKHGISTILCTPTATPPRWLTFKHPEILRENEAGQRMQHGSRQHACYSNECFRKYSRLITSAMMEHFKDNPHVIGWQTDNEFHNAFMECHCPSCQGHFREFLRQRYSHDIGSLNQAWGTDFWCQKYASFDELATPRNHRPQILNPSQKIDYYRYLSHIVTVFQHEQVGILRKGNPDWFVFHNGGFPHIDYRGGFTRDLDVLGFDSYPFFENDPDRRPIYQQGFLTDLIRSMSGNFLVAEHQSGPGGAGDWMTETPVPGEIRAMTYRSIAHGADGILYFRWRTCRFGAEQYWCGILDHDNIPRRRYVEIAQTGMEMEKLSDSILGSHVHVDVAIAGYDSIACDMHDVATLGFPHMIPISQGIYQFFHKRHHAIGFIHPEDDLSGVKLYFLPHWSYFRPEWVPALEQFVRKGGMLVIGARTATKDDSNHVVAETPPGLLAGLAGAHVEEYGKLNEPRKRNPRLQFSDGVMMMSSIWHESLSLHGAEPLAVWTDGHLAGSPAISMHHVGAGRVIYVGTLLSEELCESLCPRLVALSGLSPLWPGLPSGMDVCCREKDGSKFLFMINHSSNQLTVKRTPPGMDLISGKNGGSERTFEPQEVALYHYGREE